MTYTVKSSWPLSTSPGIQCHEVVPSPFLFPSDSLEASLVTVHFAAIQWFRQLCSDTLVLQGCHPLPPTVAEGGTPSQVHSALPWLSHWPVTQLEYLPTAPIANFRIHSGKPGFCCMPEPSLSTPAGKAVGNLSHSEWSPPPSTNKCFGILLLTQIESVTSCWQNCLAFSASHKMSSPTPAAEAIFCSVRGWVGALEYSQTQSQTSLSFPEQFLESKQFSIGGSAFCHSLRSSNGYL